MEKPTWSRECIATAGVLDEISEERFRQIHERGWTIDHDDEEHEDGTLVELMSRRLDEVALFDRESTRHGIGMAASRRRLVLEVVAIGVAELERMDRYTDRETAIIEGAAREFGAGEGATDE